MTMRVRRQSGLSMVELMIALTLGAILLAGVVQLFVTTRRSYSSNTAVDQLQESARFALNFLGGAVRQAGYLGCSNSNSPNFGSIITGATGNFDMDFTQGITGYAATSGGTVIGPGTSYTMSAVPSSSTAAPTYAADTDPNAPAMETSLTSGPNSTYPYPALPGSDVLVIRETDNNTMYLQSPFPAAGATQLTVDLPSGVTISAGQLGIVTNCISGLSFQMSSVSTAPSGSTTVATVTYAKGSVPAPGNSTTGFGVAYAAGSRLVLPYTYTFYVGRGADGTPALYQQYFAASTSQRQYQELVSGVESMHVLYGIDPTTAGAPAYYTTADQVANWAQVVSVQIGLVLESNTGAIPVPNTSSIYLFGPSGFGGALTLTPPSDTRLRRVLTTTIALREHLQ